MNIAPSQLYINHNLPSLILPNTNRLPSFEELINFESDQFQTQNYIINEISNLKKYSNISAKLEKYKYNHILVDETPTTASDFNDTFPNMLKEKIFPLQMRKLIEAEDSFLKIILQTNQPTHLNTLPRVLICETKPSKISFSSFNIKIKLTKSFKNLSHLTAALELIHKNKTYSLCLRTDNHLFNPAQKALEIKINKLIVIPSSFYTICLDRLAQPFPSLHRIQLKVNFKANNTHFEYKSLLELHKVETLKSLFTTKEIFLSHIDRLINLSHLVSLCEIKNQVFTHDTIKDFLNRNRFFWNLSCEEAKFRPNKANLNTFLFTNEIYLELLSLRTIDAFEANHHRIMCTAVKIELEKYVYSSSDVNSILMNPTISQQKRSREHNDGSDRPLQKKPRG